jgi:hypothetical protein
MKIVKYCILVVAVLTVAAVGFMSCIRGGKLESITVIPNNITIVKGTAQQFAAIAKFSDGTTLNWTSASTWSSSDDTAVTISNTAGSNGLATSLITGTTGTITITATDTAINLSAATTLYIDVPQSIVITPTNPYMAVGTAHQLTATAQFPSTASTQNVTSFATWTTSSAGVATIGDTAGFKGHLSSVATGTTNITASIATGPTSTISGTTMLTVTSTPLASITVTPPNPIIAPGAPQQFDATGTFQDSSTQVLTQSVTWSSSNTGVAPIDNTGLATAVTAGTTTITATDPITGRSGSATLIVQ